MVLSLARCSRGQLGIITGRPRAVTYRDAFGHCTGTGMAWVGRHLSPRRFLKPWSSRAPYVIMHGWQLAIITVCFAAVLAIAGTCFRYAFIGSSLNAPPSILPMPPARHSCLGFSDPACEPITRI